MGFRAFSGKHGREDSDDINESTKRSVQPSQHAIALLLLPAFFGEEAARGLNHIVSFYVWESAQHGFVGQVWSGRVVGIRPTRCPLRPAVRRDEPEERLKG